MLRLGLLLGLIAGLLTFGVMATGTHPPPTIRLAQVGNQASLAALVTLGGLEVGADASVLEDTHQATGRGILRYAQRADVNAPLPSTSLARAKLGTEFAFDAVSLAFDPSDWNDPDIGLYANPFKRGPRWERGACLSFFQAGRLVAETTVGIRIHGGTSRRMQEKGIRLTLSSTYGSSAAVADLLPGAMGKTLVLRNSTRSTFFASAMAYEVAARLGCHVPRTRPVRLLLNGIEQNNVYSLTQHIGRDYLRARLGHDHFVSVNEKKALKPQRYVSQRQHTTRARPARMRDLERDVDVGALIDWLTAVLICGAYDPLQGTAYLELDGAGRWQWALWDLDWAFQPWPQAIRGRPVRPRSITASLLQPWDLRTTLFCILLEDDPDFRARFLARVSAALNHELAATALRDIVDRYRRIANVYGRDLERRILASLNEVEAFMADRPPQLRAELAMQLGLGPVHRVTVDAPPGVRLVIDGHVHEPPYTGHYFANQTVAATIEGGPFEWRVNDSPRGAGNHIELPVDRDLRLEAIRP